MHQHISEDHLKIFKDLMRPKIRGTDGGDVRGIHAGVAFLLGTPGHDCHVGVLRRIGSLVGVGVSLQKEIRERVRGDVGSYFWPATLS